MNSEIDKNNIRFTYLLLALQVGKINPSLTLLYTIQSDWPIINRIGDYIAESHSSIRIFVERSVAEHRKIVA